MTVRTRHLSRIEQMRLTVVHERQCLRPVGFDPARHYLTLSSRRSSLIRHAASAPHVGAFYRPHCRSIQIRGSAPMTNINLDVYTSESFDLPNGGTFSPTTSTLITGDTQAILVDTQYREPDVREVIRRIEASGKTLTTIFITHGHFDHYFGLEMLLAQFPYARAVATPAVAAYIDGNHSAERTFATSLFDTHALDSTVVPQPLDSDTLQLDDTLFRVIDLEQADIAPTSIVHIPSIGAVIAGDAIYNGVNPFLAASGPADWPKWVA